MGPVTLSQGATWAIALLATSGVIVRPWRLPEALWATLGAVALVVLSLLPWTDALRAVGNGNDVYLFLTGMMLLSEVGRSEGLFDWLAALAARWAHGSAERLFALVYAVGAVVTVFLSNDATAVVLTPAVYATARAVSAPPLPYLFACAFIANAASFVLPISNPANLVVFGSHLPSLGSWLYQFALPSILAIGATYAALRLTQSSSLRKPIAKDIELPQLSTGGRVAAFGIGVMAIALLLASALGLQLGLPTFVAGALTLAVVALHERQAPWGVLKGVSWSILPLVAGLFVLVEGLRRTGALAALGQVLQGAAERSVSATAWGAGTMVAFACNILNNLPAGLIAGNVATAAQVPSPITGALLVGVDLGPNLSVTGSLATILWLVALRREGMHVNAWTFFRVGLIVMPPALLLALGGLIWLQAR